MPTSVRSELNQPKKHINTIVEKVPFISNRTEQKLNDLVSSVTRISKRYIKTSRQYIKENPGTGLAVATAVGFIAGTVFSIAIRRSK